MPQFYGLIYCAKNKVNGKCYVGQTIRKLGERISKHKYDAFDVKSSPYNSKFARAIRKYGFDVFEWSILQKSRNEETLDRAERRWIKKLDCMGNGYNMSTGGWGGGKMSEEARKNMSIAMKARILSPEARANITRATRNRSKEVIERVATACSEFNRKISIKGVEKVFRLHNRGLLNTEIAKIMHVGQVTVASVLNKKQRYMNEIEIKKNPVDRSRINKKIWKIQGFTENQSDTHGILNKKDIERIFELSREYNRLRIAEIMSIHHGTVRRVLYKERYRHLSVGLVAYNVRKRSK